MNRQKVDRAGVIPFYIDEDDNIKMMFQIAKGKCEEGETEEQTAMREGNEELGLFSGNVTKKHDLGTFLGRTTVFVCEIKDTNMFGDTCDETEETVWWTPEEFDNEGRDLHKPVVKAAVRWIEKNK